MANTKLSHFINIWLQLTYTLMIAYLTAQRKKVAVRLSIEVYIGA